MAKNRNADNPQNSMNKEISIDRRAHPSAAVAKEAAMFGSRAATDIRPPKDPQDEAIDAGPLGTDDGQNATTGEALALEQPVVVALAASPQTTPTDGVAGDAGAALADGSMGALGQNLVLAKADGMASDQGQTLPKDDGNSGGSGHWWLLGGLAAAGAGVGIAVAGDDGPRGGVTVVSGTVTDGPVQGAKVYVDVNGNGTYDEGTDTAVLDANGNQVVTDALGNFTFTTTQNPAGLRLVTHGGIDTVTGEAVKLDFSAPPGYSQINPITSAIAAYMEAHPGASITQAETAVETALGLPDLDYATINLADPPQGLAAADLLAAQQTAAILATTAIVIAQSGADADAFQYIAGNMGSGGNTDALVVAVHNNPGVDQAAADQLTDTVAAVEAATSLDAIDSALNDTFFADLLASGTLSVGQTVSGELGLGNTTGLDVAYQWQASADGITWTDIAGATGKTYQLTQGESGDHIRLEAVYTDTAGVVQTVYSSDMGVVPAANVAPVLGDDTVSLAENSANGAAVQTVAATDADGDTLSYSITAGNASGAFAINAATGAITVADTTKLDFETTQSFSLTVQASDGSLTDTGTVTVNLTGQNDNAPVITSGGTGSVTENAATGTVIYDAAATDADAGSTITYSLKAGGDAALLNIDPASGQVTLKNSADFETKASYGFTVIAADGVNSSEQAVTVGVTDLNDNAPVITSGGAGSVAENAATSTVIYDAAATDGDAGSTITYILKAGGDAALLNIDATTGEVTLKNSADFETKAGYGFTVIASDGTNSSEQAVTVGVTNINEHFVVEKSGAWIDLNANGVRDGEDTTAADFTPGTGNVDLTALPAVIHFNNMPTNDLSLAGFGADDLIQIDAQAFIDNGHNALQILTRPNMMTLDEFTGFYAATITNTGNNSSVVNTFSAISNFVPSISAARQTGTEYHIGNVYPGVTTTLSAMVNLEVRSNFTFTQRTLRFVLASTSTSTAMQLTGIPADIPLQEVVDFVNVPLPPAAVHVVVERDGAVIDIDGDGIRDNGENRLAQFGAGGTADLAGATPVTIHFNDIPSNALDLTGFGTDDKLEFDIQALRQNSILDTAATQLSYISAVPTTGTPVTVRYAFNSFSSSPMVLTVRQSSGMITTFNGSTHANAYALQFTTMWTTINGRSSGAFAYWTDAGNALNNATNILPGYTGGNTSAVLATLNSNAPHVGLVDFVWPVHVVVDDQAGNVATFIDANANGVRELDGSEDTLALLGQTQADVDAFNTAAGTGYGSQAVDLAAEQVTIHYNDLPTADWMPDLTGFNGNDRIEIDVTAMRSLTDTIRLSNQNIPTSSSITTQFYAGVSGVSSGNTAAYLSGGNLNFGHRTATPTNTGPSPAFRTYYTATGSLEGAIASNATALANHFQQVVFVTSVI